MNIIHLNRRFHDRGRSSSSLLRITSSNISVSLIMSELTSSNRIELSLTSSSNRLTKTRKRKRESMNNQLEVVDEVRVLELHVVDPHRRQRATASWSSDGESFADFESRKNRHGRESLEVSEPENTVRHDVKPNAVNIGMTAMEDRGIIDGEDRHVVEVDELGELDAHRESEDAVAAGSESEHCVGHHHAVDGGGWRRMRERE